jgi:hypothetical protein
MDYSPEVVRRFLAAGTAAAARDGRQSGAAGRRVPAESVQAEPASAEPVPGGSIPAESVPAESIPADSAMAEAEDRALNVWVRFRVEVSRGYIRSAEFEVFGCPHTVAAASWAADWLRGGRAERLERLDVQEMRRALDVPTEKLGKLLRLEDAVLACSARLRHAANQRRKAIDGGIVDEKCG